VGLHLVPGHLQMLTGEMNGCRVAHTQGPSRSRLFTASCREGP
jgi:hypothetical protein